MKPVKYIYRINSDSANCWQVRALDDYISKVFSDSKHGGKTKALTAAKAYLKKAVRELPPRLRKRYDQNQKGMFKPDAGTNKIYGSGANQGVHNGWAAHYWMPGEGLQQKYFGFKAYGKREAKRLALKFRRQGLAKVAKVKK